MLRTLEISPQETIQHLKLSCQIPAVVEAIVSCKIILDKAAEMGLKVESEELQQAADSLRLANNLLQADATWTWLQKHCLSLDEFEEIAQTNALSSKLAQHLLGDRVEPFFVEHQLDYAKAILYEVVLDDEDLAMELFYALQQGEMQFHEVAYEYIQETELRRLVGYRGEVSRTDLRPEISAAVFAATPPQLLKPIVTPKGVHLIRVEEILQPRLNDALRVKILADLYSDWLKQQVEQVEVVTRLNAASSDASFQSQLPQPEASMVSSA